MFFCYGMESAVHFLQFDPDLNCYYCLNKNLNKLERTFALILHVLVSIASIKDQQLGPTVLCPGTSLDLEMNYFEFISQVMVAPCRLPLSNCVVVSINRFNLCY